MKVRKVTYNYHYWFRADWRRKHEASQLFNEMRKWLHECLDLSDYRARYDNRDYKYVIDFREEHQYTFFALCWDSRVAEFQREKI